MENRIKPFEELTLKDDYMFKRVMSNKAICKKTLELILNIKIKDIKYPEEEKTLKNSYISKGVRLDVYVEDDKNTVYDIEMQVRSLPEDEFAKRLRYYQSAIDADTLKSGMLYTELKNSFIIFICPFKVFDGKRHLYTFKHFCQENKKLKLKDGATKVILSTKGKLDDVTPEVKAFLEYIEASSLSGDDFVKELDNTVKTIKEKESERVNYNMYNMKILEEKASAFNAGKEEGKKEGEKEGEIKGESKLKKLLSKLLSDGKKFDLQELLSNDAKIKELYANYGIV